MSKADLYPNSAGIPGIEARILSAKTGLGIEQWLDEILAGCQNPGTRFLDIDYEEYARAEAALVWLNLSLTFEPAHPTSPAFVVGPLLDDLDKALAAAEVGIVHLKLIDQSSTGWVKAAICANGQEPTVEGDLDASASNRHDLLLNLRAIGSDPQSKNVVERIEDLIKKQIATLNGNVLHTRLNCFIPSPPRPEKRLVKTRP